MIDIILNMTRSGNSWERMGLYYKINADTIRKRFYKWVDLDVFKLAKRAILKIYKNICNNSRTFILILLLLQIIQVH